jgi:hypothetical protein
MEGLRSFTATAVLIHKQINSGLIPPFAVSHPFRTRAIQWRNDFKIADLSRHANRD